MKTKIIIPSSGVIELYDNLPVSLNYNIADIRKPQSRNADYSKTITAPGTANNNKLLAHIFEIGTNRLFNPNHKTNAEIVVDDVSVMKGILRLARIKSLEGKKIEYELEFKGRLDDLFTSVKDVLISDIDWSDLDHTWNNATIINSWTATVGEGYVYPFIDYGVGTNSTAKDVTGFRPATYAKEIWDRIFSYAGFQYSSTFLNTDFFKRLIIPFYNEKFVRASTQIQNNIFRAHRTTSQSFSFSSFDPGNFSTAVANTIRYNNDSTSPSSDAGNNYNISTGKFTASEPGNYTFYASNSVTFQHNSPGNVNVNGYFRVIRNGNQVLSYSPLVIAFPLAPSPSSYTASDIPVQWNGYLNQGETIEIQTYFIIQNPFNTTFPTVQANSVNTNSYFYNSLDASYNYFSAISYAQAVPQNVKMEDFLLSIMKMFNLYFEYDKDTPNKIHIEPRNDYYNSTIQDWTYKQDVSKELEITPMGALDAKRYIFKYKPDKDWLNEKYQTSFQQLKDESYGIRVKSVDNDFLKEDLITEPLFSPTPQYSDSTSDRVYPRIIKVDPVTNAISPVTANMRILYYSGMKSCQQWAFHTYALDAPSPSNHFTYPYCGHIDDPTAPLYDLSFGVPKELYYIPAWAATYTNNNLYNRFYKQFIDEITDKDSSIVTGWFHLTPADIAQVDFRHIYRFGFQNYRLNKIYDYNPVHDGVTKVEFIKTKDSVPFVYENIPAIGGTGNNFTAEAGPSFPFVPGNPIGPSKGRVVSEGGNWVPASVTSGVIVIGTKNIVGDNVKNITILQSSGVTIIHNNVTMIQSSGVSSTGDNQLWIYNTLVTSGAIAHMALEGCPIPKTVAQMQAMATAATINPCAEYLLTDAYNNWGLLRIRGRATTKLEPEGTIFIHQTSGVHNVGYNLTYDQITHIFDEHQNNLIYNPAGTNRGGNCITEFPRGSDSYYNNVINGSDIFITSSGSCTINNSDLGVYSTITISGTSGTATIIDAVFSNGPQININGSTLTSIKAGNTGVLTLTNASNMTQCDMGENVTVTMDGSVINSCYIDMNSIITLYYSTLQFSRIIGGLAISFPPGTWSGNINKVDGTSTFETTLSIASGTYDFIRSGVDYSFCGIFRSTSTAAPINVTAFANASLNGQMNTRFVKIYGSATHTVRFIHGANMICKGATSIVLTSAVQWAEFMIVTNGASVIAYESNRHN